MTSRDAKGLARAQQVRCHSTVFAAGVRPVTFKLRIVATSLGSSLDVDNCDSPGERLERDTVTPRSWVSEFDSNLELESSG